MNAGKTQKMQQAAAVLHGLAASLDRTATSRFETASPLPGSARHP